MKDKLSIYLVGAIEMAKDSGLGWREEITPFLEELGLNVINPVLLENEQLKGCHLNTIPEYYEDFLGKRHKTTQWHDLLQSRTDTEEGKVLYNRALKYMRKIIEFDCDIVNTKADIILCYWNEALKNGAGSQSELTLGYLKGIPIYTVATCRMAAWARGCSSTVELNWDAMKERLIKDYGTKK
jgi:hypothetical protein